MGGRAFVTGASGTIGKAVARALARRGVEVWLGCKTRVEETEALQRELQSSGATVMPVVCELSQHAECEVALKPLLQSRGPVNILVHCAGIVRRSLLLGTSPQDWEAVLSGNVTSFYNAARILLRGMIQQRDGMIIALGSVVGDRGLEGQVAYAASKAALLGAVRSLAREAGPHNVRVNLVCPGWIDGGMNETRSVKPVLERIPLRRPGSPEDVASLVDFLCSPAASYITGAMVPVSGGLDM